MSENHHSNRVGSVYVEEIKIENHGDTTQELPDHHSHSSTLTTGSGGPVHTAAAAVDHAAAAAAALALLRRSHSHSPALSVEEDVDHATMAAAAASQSHSHSLSLADAAAAAASPFTFDVDVGHEEADGLDEFELKHQEEEADGGASVVDSMISGSETPSYVSCMHAPSDLQSTADRRARDYQFFIADDDEQREREEQLRRDLLAQRDRDDLNMSQYAMSISDRDTVASMSERASLIDGVGANSETGGAPPQPPLASASLSTGLGLAGLSSAGGLSTSSRLGLARALGQLSAPSTPTPTPAPTFPSAFSSSAAATTSIGAERSSSMTTAGNGTATSTLGGFGSASSSTSAALASLASLSLNAGPQPRFDRSQTEPSTASLSQSAFAPPTQSTRSALESAPSEAGSDRLGFSEHVPYRHQRRAGAHRHVNHMSIHNPSSSPPVSIQAPVGPGGASNSNISSSYMSPYARQTSGAYARSAAQNMSDELSARTLANRPASELHVPHLNMLQIFLRDLRVHSGHSAPSDIDGVSDDGRTSMCSQCNVESCPVCARTARGYGYAASVLSVSTAGGGVAHRRGRERSGSRIRFDLDDLNDKSSVIDDSASIGGGTLRGTTHSIASASIDGRNFDDTRSVGTAPGGVGGGRAGGGGGAPSANGEEESYPPSIAGSISIGGGREHATSLSSTSGMLPPGGLGFNSRSGPGSVVAGGLGDDSASVAGSVTDSIADSVAESTASMPFVPPSHLSFRHIRPPPTSRHISRTHARSFSRSSSSLRSHSRRHHHRRRHRNSINIMSQSPPTHSFIPSPVQSPRHAGPSNGFTSSPRAQSTPKSSYSPAPIFLSQVHVPLPALLELPASTLSGSMSAATSDGSISRSRSRNGDDSPSLTRRPPSPALSSRSQPPPNSPVLTAVTSVSRASSMGRKSPRSSAKHARSRSTSGPSKNKPLECPSADAISIVPPHHVDACMKALRSSTRSYLGRHIPGEDEDVMSAASVDCELVELGNEDAADPDDGDAVRRRGDADAGGLDNRHHQKQHKKSFCATLSTINLENHQKTQQKLSLERGEDQSHVQRVVNSLRGTLEHLHAAHAGSDSSLGTSDNRAKESIALSDANISRILSHFGSPPPPGAPPSVFSYVSSAPSVSVSASMPQPPLSTSTSTPNSLLDDADGMLSECAFSVKSYDSSSHMNNMAAVK